MEFLTPKLQDYWKQTALTFEWKKKWTTLLSGDFSLGNTKWFLEGKLNITDNCLDRHVKTQPNGIALIFEPNTPRTQDDKTKTIWSYQELLDDVCMFADALKKQGVKKGEVVAFYMGMTPELLIGILACARIGAPHTVIFGGFSPLSLQGRLNDSKAVLLVTHDGAYRGEKNIALKNMVDEATSPRETVPYLKKVIVAKRTHGNISMRPGFDLFYDEFISSTKTFIESEEMDAEDPLFILYTSGSTGKPKGLLHTTGGYMVHVGKSFRDVFQFQTGDIFWCTADIGWITGHSYLTYGPLLNGGTTLMFEGIPTFPTPHRFWEIIELHKVTHFYTAPTAIRSLEKLGSQYPECHEMSSLKVLGSVGEPINEEAWDWYHRFVGKGKCPIVDTWWQTETGGIMISPIAHKTPMKPAHATFPLEGIEPVLLNEKGQIINETKAEGRLCIKTPWPSLARTIYGDHQKFIDTYFKDFPGFYFTGDGARRDELGNYRITGRIDDVINVSGHRLGTAEIENAINEHIDVVESAVVGVPHEIKGQGIFAFVVLKNNQPKTREEKDKLALEIKNLVVKMIGPIARPDILLLGPGLPKTRSGKIMRRILRKISEKEFSQLGDISTLLNPEIVDELILLSKTELL